MKQYHSITHSVHHGQPYYAFSKLDGSNIRASWSRKHKAFTKFGSRTQLIDSNCNHPSLGKAPFLVKNKYEKDLTVIFLESGFEEVTCFFEFYGENSFAGNHDITDNHDVVLFDINVYKQGIIGPKEFLKLFDGKVDIPNVVYHGNITQDFINQVKENNVDGMAFEGVVCKGAPLKNGYPPHMFKIKSTAWLQKLKTFCNGNEQLEKELL